MADKSCVETLEPLLIRLKVLGQIQPGHIVVLDDAGNWLLSGSSSVKSALRKLWALLTQNALQPQRAAFLKSAKDTVRLLIRHCALLMKTTVFGKCIDPRMGIVSTSLVNALTADERGEFEGTLHTLRAVSAHLYEALRGLVILKTNEPYTSDLTWCSEMSVMVIDVIVQFLEQVYQRFGREHAERVLPFIRTDPNAAHSASPIIALAQLIGAIPATNPLTAKEAGGRDAKDSLSGKEAAANAPRGPPVAVGGAASSSSATGGKILPRTGSAADLPRSNQTS